MQPEENTAEYCKRRERHQYMIEPAGYADLYEMEHVDRYPFEPTDIRGLPRFTEFGWSVDGQSLNNRWSFRVGPEQPSESILTANVSVGIQHAELPVLIERACISAPKGDSGIYAGGSPCVITNVVSVSRGHGIRLPFANTCLLQHFVSVAEFETKAAVRVCGLAKFNTVSSNLAIENGRCIGPIIIRPQTPQLAARQEEVIDHVRLTRLDIRLRGFDKAGILLANARHVSMDQIVIDATGAYSPEVFGVDMRPYYGCRNEDVHIGKLTLIVREDQLRLSQPTIE